MRQLNLDQLTVGLYYIFIDRTTQKETIFLYKGEVDEVKHAISFVDPHGVERNSFLVPYDIIISRTNSDVDVNYE